MAERAHPEDLGFQGTIYEQKMHERYRFGAGYARGRDVLDVGCGTGWGWIHLYGARSVTGVDVSEQALREARRLEFGDRVVAAEMQSLPFAPAAFDVVVCLEAIEHLPAGAAAELLQECYRVLRAGGTLVLSTPLRNNGRHSGNPWHLVEFSEQEIGQLLEHSFECVEMTVDRSLDSPVLLYAGRRRQESSGLPTIRWTDSGVHERALVSLEQVKSEAGFQFTKNGQVTVTSTALGVLLAEGLQQLPAVPAEAAELLLSAQDAGTGLFLEPLAGLIPLRGQQHDESYFHGVTTYFALHALDALQQQPRHALSFLNALQDKRAVRGWLEELDFSNPWLESNRVMHLLSGYLFALKWEKAKWAADCYHCVLDWLDEQQDPVTGLWGTNRGASLLNAAAGAYHFVPFYRYARRPVRSWSKIQAACLELQQEDGLFGPSRGGGACEDLDVVDLLCCAVRATGKLTRETRMALTRAFWAIWNMQRDDGGFPYAKVDHDGTYCFGSWPAMEARLRDSDLWSTWFRLVALHTIQRTLGTDLPSPGSWTFRRVPALGFHLEDRAIPPTAPPEHRAIWFRSLPAPPKPASPRAAVVVTCFNLGEYIHEALCSVRNQTLKDIETVVVDDGSPDAYTVARLDALARDGWQVIRTENRGLPAARNLGIRETSAPYICCLDADDRLRPTYLEQSVAVLDQDPDAGLVSCFYTLFDEEQGTYRYTKVRLPEMLARNEAVGVSLFRRQAWVDTGGYCESLAAMQDWDLWLSILEKGWQGRVLPAVLFEYRIRAGSMYSSTKKPARYVSIAASISARHAGLYREFAREVFQAVLKDRAELIEWMEIQRRSWLRSEAELKKRVKSLDSQESEKPNANQHANGAKEQSETAASPPYLWKTVLWSLAVAAQPRENWRGLRNLYYAARMFSSRPKRALWYSLFDAEAYGRKRPDVLEARIHSSLHYLLCGAWDFTDASAHFSTALYWQRHPDVAASGLNPLLHYVLFGKSEGRIAIPASPMFALDDLFKDLSKEGPAIVSPLVSVVIPCFNLGDYVEQAVSSVLHQTLKNIEVIVVEGGSTDGQTRQRVEEMAANPDSRLRVFFRHGEHLAGDNRNFGIERASGRYVCCLDADDWIDSSYLEAAVFLAEFFDYDLVSCSLQEFGASNGVWMVEDPSWPQILRRNQVSTAALFRRDLWECLGGYRDWDKGKDHLPEDWDYWIRAVAAGFRGKAIRDTLLHYRVRPDSLSRSSAATKEDLARRMAEVHRDLTTLEAPPPRPLAPFPRAAWACLQAPQARTAMLVVPYFIAVGGAERIFRMLLEEWSRRGFRTLVVATLKPSPKVADGLDSLRNITPHVYSLPNLFPDEPHQQAAFLYFLFRRYGPELVFTAGSDFFYELMPELHEHFPGLAVVDQLFNDKVHLPTNRAFASYIGCTCVPEQGFAAKLIEEYGERPDRVAVVPHGIRIPVTGPSLPPPGWPAEFDGKPVVGFFGRLSPEKAPVDFVQIAAKVAKARPDARFVMTGDGPEKEAVLRALVKSRLGRAFCFAGLVENVHDWMASCSMAVLPSRLDGMPLAVLEAMALGIPVVASRVGSVPEMVKDGVTGVLCKPGDPGAFAAAICRLLGEAHLREAMGRAAKERVQQEFLDTIMLDRYFAVFERLTSKKTAGTGPRAGM